MTYKYNDESKEDFFVSYAIRGPIVSPAYGIRSGIPVRYPIYGPVHQPSPLNSQYLYDYPYYTGRNLLSYVPRNRNIYYYY